MDENNIYSAWQSPAEQKELEEQPQTPEVDRSRSFQDTDSPSEANVPKKEESTSSKEEAAPVSETKPEGIKETKDNVTRGREIYGNFKNRMSGVMNKLSKFGDGFKNKIFNVLGATAAGAEKGANKMNQILEMARGKASQFSEKVTQINEKVSNGFYEAGHALGKSIAESSDAVINKAKDIGLSHQGYLTMQKIVWNKNKIAQMPTPEQIKALQLEKHRQIDAQADSALREYDHQQKYLQSLEKNLTTITQELNKRKSAQPTGVPEHN